MKIDHGNLRALAAVVREGSFERAAASLSVTPSAISQRIKALEERMGRLLVQRGVPAEATPDGRILVQLAEQSALLEHRSEEHTSELQSLMRISYAVFCLKKKKYEPHTHIHDHYRQTPTKHTPCTTLTPTIL